MGLKGGGRRSRRDTDTDSTSDSDSGSHSRRKKSRKRSSKGELTQALRAMTSLADSVARICRSIQQPPQTVTPEASAPQHISTERQGGQIRDPTEPPQGELKPPQTRRRYCVNIDTRQGERQVLLHDPGYQPQPPAPPSNPLSAQISATTKRGCRPWAGSPWGPGNRGANLLLTPPPSPNFLSVYFFLLSTPHGSCITSGCSDCVQLTDYTNTPAAAPGQRRAAGGLFREHPTKH